MNFIDELAGRIDTAVFDQNLRNSDEVREKFIIDSVVNKDSLNALNHVDTPAGWINIGDDENERYVLGRLGKRHTLLCVGINPSTAGSQNVNDRSKIKLDPTTREIEAIVNDSDTPYDGWLIINIYPKRASKPKDLDIEENPILVRRNLLILEKLKKYLADQEYTVWAAWGNMIGLRKYLLTELKAIYELGFNGSWVKRGPLTKVGNPRHPLWAPDVPFTDFDIEDYLRLKELENI